LAIDNSCKCQMGNGDIRSPFSCAQCKNLRRLIDFRLGGIDRAFQIECGNLAGKELIVTSSEISDPFLEWDMESVKRANIYHTKYYNLSTCGSKNIKNLKCITGDSFTIKTLIMWMISKIFKENLPHCSWNFIQLLYVQTLGIHYIPCHQ